MVETKCGCHFVWLKLDTWPHSAILDLPFIARHLGRVLPTSFTGDVTSKLARMTGDEAALKQQKHVHSQNRGIEYGSLLTKYSGLWKVAV